MNQKMRLLIGLLVILLLAAGILAVEGLRGGFAPGTPAGATVTLEPGSVPIYFNDGLLGGLVPRNLERLEQVSFEDAAKANPKTAGCCGMCWGCTWTQTSFPRKPGSSSAAPAVTNPRS